MTSLHCSKTTGLLLKSRELVFISFLNTSTITSWISLETGPEVVNVNKNNAHIKQLIRKLEVGNQNDIPVVR